MPSLPCIIAKARKLGFALLRSTADSDVSEKNFPSGPSESTPTLAVGAHERRDRGRQLVWLPSPQAISTVFDKIGNAEPREAGNRPG